MAVVLSAFAIIPLSTSAMAAELGTVTGTVTSASHPGGVPDVEVLFRAEGGGETHTYTDENGQYSKQLDAGVYTVRFTPSLSGLARQFYYSAPSASLSTIVVVTPGGTESGINAYLNIGNAVSGTVTNDQNDPLEDVNVYIFDVDDDERLDAFWARTDENGEYDIGAIPDGEYYLYFDPSDQSQDYVARYYSSSLSQKFAWVIDLGGAEHKVLNTQLDLGGSISGHVSVDPATDVNITVAAYGVAPVALGITHNLDHQASAAGSSNPDVYFAGYGLVDSETGDYVIRGLAGREHYVLFSAVDATTFSPVYVPEYYNDGVSLKTAAKVSVVAAADTPGINAVLTIDGPPITEPITDSDRLYGSNRYATSANIAEKFSETGGYVFIASGEHFPDALSLAAVAGVYKAPLLLTHKDGLPSEVKAQIQQLEPSQIVVAGGEGAVSKAVYDELATMTVGIQRVGGSNRYETSRKIAETLFGSVAFPFAFLATGRDFPDALSAASAAAKLGAPVILVDGTTTTVDAPTVALFEILGTRHVYIAGGTGVVSTGIEDSVRALPGIVGVDRLAGSNRYLTSVKINTRLFTAASTAYLATGTGFADALSGAALAGATDSPLYLAMPNCVPRATIHAIAAQNIGTTVLLGGPGALGPNVQALKPC